MEFLKLIEDVKLEEANIHKIFNKDDGRPVRRGIKSPEYMAKLSEAVELIGQILNGKRPMYHFQEVMTTSDFPLLFADVLDRQLLAGYREAPATYKAYCRISTVRDFRQVSRHYVDGGDGRLDAVAEKEEYKYASLSEGKYNYSVKKYGRKFDFSWETLVNDDLGAFNDAPLRLGRAARRTEEYFATTLFVGASGPLATFYKAANKNIVTANPVLSVEALQTAMAILGAQTDAAGEPIFMGNLTLVVPPALEIVAQNILNAIEILAKTSGGGTAAQEIKVLNWMKNRIKLVVNAYIPIVASTANGATSWFLFADPANSRGSLEVGFLRGYTEPQVFMKSSNQTAVGGGGLIDPLQGDFDSDNIEYKVRHVTGGCRLDPKLTCASNGSGS
ncbi:hypothetical protein ES708_10055 [subsurface metagenome]